MLRLETRHDNSSKLMAKIFSEDPHNEGYVIHHSFNRLSLYHLEGIRAVDEETVWKSFFKYYVPNLFGKLCLWDDVNEDKIYDKRFFQTQTSFNTYFQNTFYAQQPSAKVLARICVSMGADLAISYEDAEELLEETYLALGEDHDLENLSPLHLTVSPILYVLIGN